MSQASCQKSSLLTVSDFPFPADLLHARVPLSGLLTDQNARIYACTVSSPPARLDNKRPQLSLDNLQALFNDAIAVQEKLGARSNPARVSKYLSELRMQADDIVTHLKDPNVPSSTPQYPPTTLLDTIQFNKDIGFLNDRMAHHVVLAINKYKAHTAPLIPSLDPVKVVINAINALQYAASYLGYRCDDKGMLARPPTSLYRVNGHALFVEPELAGAYALAVCAATGAMVNEVRNLRRKDIRIISLDNEVKVALSLTTTNAASGRREILLSGELATQFAFITYLYLSILDPAVLRLESEYMDCALISTFGFYDDQANGKPSTELIKVVQNAHSGTVIEGTTSKFRSTSVLSCSPDDERFALAIKAPRALLSSAYLVQAAELKALHLKVANVTTSKQ